MTELEQLAKQLKRQLGREYDEWRNQHDQYGRGPRPDHDRQWHAVRLLLRASDHGSLDVLSQAQLRTVKSFVHIGPMPVPRRPFAKAA